MGLALIAVLAMMVAGLRVAEQSDSIRPGVAGPQRGTTVVHVRPVDDRGRFRSGFTVADTVPEAKCYADSSAIVVAAERCVAGEYIYDPCWTETDGPAGPSVACMIEPWTQTVERLLTETKSAPDPLALDSDGSPWSVELVDGQRCRVASGAHDSLNPSSGDDADVVDYYCGEADDLVLLRGIDKTHPVWTARAARHIPPNDRYERLGRKAIATAWY